MNSLPLDWCAAPMQGLLKARPLLRPEHVLLRAPVTDLRQAFDAIGRRIESARGPSAAAISERLLRRERHGSTVLGQGIALPHAQVSGLRAPVVAYLRPLRPIRARPADGQMVEDLLALLVPKPAAVPHFELLARLTQLLRDPTVRHELARCRTAAAVCELFALQAA